MQKFLRGKVFISVATCDLKGQPNAAPKLLLDFDKQYIYLVDYTIGKTWENLKLNPRVSLSFSDVESLNGYRINGSVEIIAEGPLYEKMSAKLGEMATQLSVERVLAGIRRKKAHEHFELGIPDKFVVFKIKMQEITEISPQGKLHHEKV